MPDPSGHSAATGQKPNRLIHETSPYLLQHAYNPVDWYPWGDEAIEAARSQDKPIFLSVGYSSCHWCHVMERESFEDEKVAAYLRDHFIAIKVDREERPDIDDLYMTAVQQIAGSGGWPMSVFLTPDLAPFYGGTYFPPEASHGRISFMQLLESMHDSWANRRSEVIKAANEMSSRLEVNLPPIPDSPLPDPATLRSRETKWVRDLELQFDSQFGGFGQAPKFPRAEDLRWLLAAAERSGAEKAREMALFTLRKMASGGMYDQIGGGFARYSVDHMWLVPHFEKMLYDQGTLIPAYLEAWRQTGDEFYAQIARESCEYLLREMRDEGGAFWSSTDADSEGEEGKFFVWKPAELIQVLGEERGRFAAAMFGVTDRGTFEKGHSVLRRARTPEEAAELVGFAGDAQAAARSVSAELYQERLSRIPPATDDKIIVSWNGLVIDALAQAGRMLDEPRYTAAAAQAADFVWRELRKDEGLGRSWRSGVSKTRGVLEDYAYYIRGLLSVFQSTGDELQLQRATELGIEMLARFWNDEGGMFWDTDGRDDSLLHRRVSPWDGATPAPNAVALECLALLHAFTTERKWLAVAEKGYAALQPMIDRNPRAFTASLRPFPWVLEEPKVAVVIGTGTSESLSAWRKAIHAAGRSHVLPVFRPAADEDSEFGLFAFRAAKGGKPTLYLCRGSSCLAPANDPSGYAELLSQ